MLGAVDTMVAVRRDDERLKVTIEKQKDEDEGPPIRLRTKVVDVMRGILPETSLVLESDEGAVAPDAAAEGLGRIAAALGANGRMNLSRLSDAIGVAKGRAIQDLTAAIPFGPDYLEISMPVGTVRLAKIRQSDASNSPIEVVRYDV